MNVKKSAIDASSYDVELPPRRFTGTVELQRIGELKGMSVSLVHFYEGARTYWHTHPGGQTLLILRERLRWQPVPRELLETWFLATWSSSIPMRCIGMVLHRTRI